MMIGGTAYSAIEVLWRGYSHWTMFLLGGVCFIICGALNELEFKTALSVIQQMLISALVITLLEFVTGVILNIWLGMGIWDYSDIPFNILGQVCLPFTVCWFLLSLIAIVLDDYLRYWLFGEPLPDYIKRIGRK